MDFLRKRCFCIILRSEAGKILSRESRESGPSLPLPARLPDSPAPSPRTPSSVEQGDYERADGHTAAVDQDIPELTAPAGNKTLMELIAHRRVFDSYCPKKCFSTWSKAAYSAAFRIFCSSNFLNFYVVWCCVVIDFMV